MGGCENASIDNPLRQSIKPLTPNNPTIQQSKKNKAMKNVLFIILTLILTGPQLLAQGWIRQYPANEASWARDMDATTDGGYILAGDHYPDGEWAAALAKVDAEGQLEWFESYDTTRLFYAVATASDGSYFAAGQYNDLVGNGFTDPILLKVDTLGDILWEYEYDPFPESHGFGLNVAATADGGALFTGTYYGDIPGGCQNCQVAFIVRIDASGNEVWTYQFNDPDTFFSYGRDVAETPAGDILWLGEWGYSSGPDFSLEPFLKKLDANGNLLWEKAYPSPRNEYVFDLALADDGTIWATGQSFVGFNGVDSMGIMALRFDADGDMLWKATWDELPAVSLSNRMALLPNGGAVLTGWTMADPNNPNNVAQKWMTAKIDENGNWQWRKLFDWIGNGYGQGAAVIADGPNQLTFFGGSGTLSATDSRMTLIRTDSNAVIFERLLTGTVALDDNNDCLVNAGEAGFPNQILEISKGSSSFFTTTDSEGYYEVPLDTGDYEITLFPTSPLTEACVNPQSFSVFIPDDTVAVDFPLTALSDCPYMTVDISVPFLRRCFPNTYSVNYCNLGTEAADSVYLEVTFDQYIQVDSSDIPWSSVAGDTYTFQLDSVGQGDCYNFNIYTTLECDTAIFGFTHCVEAHIFPDSLCIPLDPLWDGASIEADAWCDGDSVYLILYNTGMGDMQAPLNYIVVEDHLMLNSIPESFQLNSGDSLVLSFPANGSTWYLGAQQEPGHPGSNFPAVTIEGCGEDGDGNVSIGYVTQFSENDGDPFISIDCQQNIGAYDPNDKRGFPAGYSTEHYIEANTDLEYHIRFQNTGTDTAFTVVILDTLSSFLDPTTVVPGASSHAYDFDLIGSGVAQFTFNNIMLPDSNVNEAASIGFVKFRIQQFPDNPIGTEIFNRAGIYFDFNPPIFTNETIHRIGADFIEMKTVDIHSPEAAPDALKLYPNPFVEQATFEWEGPSLQDAQFSIFDGMGRLVRQEQVNGNSWMIERYGMESGVYFFILEEKGNLLASGKLVVY
jgi:hypothetical protein